MIAQLLPNDNTSLKTDLLNAEPWMFIGRAVSHVDARESTHMKVIWKFTLQYLGIFFLFQAFHGPGLSPFKLLRYVTVSQTRILINHKVNYRDKILFDVLSVKASV